MAKLESGAGFDAKFLQEWIMETGSLMILRGEETRQTFLKQSLHRLLWYKFPILGLTSLLSSLLTIYVHISTVQMAPYATVGALDTLLLFHYSFLTLPLELLGDNIVLQITEGLMHEHNDIEDVHRFYSLSIFMTLYYSLVMFIVGLLFKQVYITPYFRSKYEYSFKDLSIYLTIAPFVSPFLHLSNALLERTGFFFVITIQRLISYFGTAVLLSLGYLFPLLYSTLIDDSSDDQHSLLTIVPKYFSGSVFLYPIIIAILIPDSIFLCLNVLRMFSYESYKECYNHRFPIELNTVITPPQEQHFPYDLQFASTSGSFHSAASEKLTTVSLIRKHDVAALPSQETASHLQVLRAFQRSTILTRRPYSDTPYQHDLPFLLMFRYGKLFPKNTKLLITLMIDLFYRWLSRLGHVGLALFIIVFLYINIKDINLFLLNINICGVYVFVRQALLSLTIPISYIFKQIYFFNSRDKHYRKIAIAFYYYLFIALTISSLLGAIFYLLLSPQFTKYYLELGLQLTKSELSDNTTILRLEALLSPLLSLFYMVDAFLEQRGRILIGSTVKFISLTAGCVALVYIWELQKQFSDFSYPLLIADIILCICGVVLLPLVIFELQLLIFETRVESRRLK
ncbi:hypothetical protein GL50803_0087461 [Giardia duodenalis]|uniref:Uncharacterized protein n=1 Tax=Giardia intestinalis (strain ATCC 50803 / WB clone C6) TaxID=184922 RepID=D3KI13_GIAIC|nr:hypothetical protein GL50803_0087461 [Giardia intestinalis]KAE8301279.1 hypothetical protein GL50803_0087461 [Giardia intestinalis]